MFCSFSVAVLTLGTSALGRAGGVKLGAAVLEGAHVRARPAG